MSFTAAKLAWLENVLEERYGYHFSIQFDNSANALSLGLQGQELVIVFDNLLDVFHESRSEFPCGQWNAEYEGFTSLLNKPLPLPGMVELASKLVEPCKQGVKVHYDILGLTYWMLARLEEVDRRDLDNFQRFPATSSHAYRYGYLERPVVDEWLDILGQIIIRQWTQLRLKKHQFSMKVSHDVDSPSRYGFRSIKGLIRAMIGDVVKKQNIRGMLSAPLIKMSSNRQLHPADPYNTFDWIMDQSEKHGLESAFYFICGRTDPAKDADYEPEQPSIRKLMQRIHSRGHEIGLHPSFNTYQDKRAIESETNRLRDIMHGEGIRQDVMGSRMHYLRWNTSETPFALEQAGIDYDSTLTYADLPGFRCGTCHEYQMFDAAHDRAMALRIRPLVAMECTVMEAAYMGLGIGRAAYEKFMELKSACRAAEGCFTLLWHNSNLTTQEQKRLYQSLLGVGSCEPL